MKIYTVEGNRLKGGCLVEKVELPQYDIRAVVVGEEGRKRKRGLLCTSARLGLLTQAGLKKSSNGAWRLVQYGLELEDHCIVIFKTPIGFRGGSSLTGDDVIVKETSDLGLPAQVFKPFPGYYISWGVIAQGLAGRDASGMQYACLVKFGEVVKVVVDSELESEKSTTYYKFTKDGVCMASKEEREFGSNPAFPEVKVYETEREAFIYGMENVIKKAFPKYFHGDDVGEENSNPVELLTEKQAG